MCMEGGYNYDNNRYIIELMSIIIHLYCQHWFSTKCWIPSVDIEHVPWQVEQSCNG